MLATQSVAAPYQRHGAAQAGAIATAHRRLHGSLPFESVGRRDARHRRHQSVRAAGIERTIGGRLPFARSAKGRFEGGRDQTLTAFAAVLRGAYKPTPGLFAPQAESGRLHQILGSPPTVEEVESASSARHRLRKKTKTGRADTPGDESHRPQVRGLGHGNTRFHSLKAGAEGPQNRDSLARHARGQNRGPTTDNLAQQGDDQSAPAGFLLLVHGERPPQIGLLPVSRHHDELTRRRLRHALDPNPQQEVRQRQPADLEHLTSDIDGPHRRGEGSTLESCPEWVESTAVNGERLQSGAACAVPGLLAGIHLAGLLFFLNPHLPFKPGPVFSTSVYYGLLGAFLSFSLLMPLGWRTPERACRRLAWTMAALFAAVAALDLWHANHYASYLPPGIHDRLMKAGLWLALAALITAYTAFAHSYPRRRPYGPRSRWGIGCLAVLTVYSVFERREAFEPPPPSQPRAAAIEPMPPPNLLVLGLDGASLDAILPLAEQGLLPFFAEMMRSGSYGRTESIEPAVRLPLWTTLATGTLPFRHGVVAEETLGAPWMSGRRIHLSPRGVGFSFWGDRGAPDRSRRIESSALPLWTIGTAFGLDGFALDGGIGLTDESVARAAALGSAMRDERLARLGDGPPAALYSAALRDLEAQAEVLRILSSRQPERRRLVVFAVMDGLASVSRLYYDAYEAVQFEGDQAQNRLDRARWLSSYYAFLDGLVAEAWGDLPRPRMLAIVSAHGWRRAGLTRRLLRLGSNAPAGGGGGAQTPDGLLLLRGQGVRENVLLNHVGIEDVAPTLLYGLNLPIALDIDGRVITEAFEPTLLARRPIAFVRSYGPDNEATKARTR